MKDVWDYLAWFMVGFITVWVILKMFGIINIPVLVEYSPLLGAVYIAGWVVQKLERATEDIKDVKIDVSDLKKTTSDLNNRLGLVENKVADMGEGMTNIENTIDTINKKCPIC